MPPAAMEFRLVENQRKRLGDVRQVEWRAGGGLKDPFRPRSAQDILHPGSGITRATFNDECKVSEFQRQRAQRLRWFRMSFLNKPQDALLFSCRRGLGTQPTACARIRQSLIPPVARQPRPLPVTLASDVNQKVSRAPSWNVRAPEAPVIRPKSALFMLVTGLL